MKKLRACEEAWKAYRMANSVVVPQSSCPDPIGEGIVVERHKETYRILRGV